MIPAFDRLSAPEIEAMFRAPLVTCILIAGADGHVDRKEIQKAMQLSKKSAKSSRQSLVEYFQFIYTDFEDKLKILMQGLPNDVNERNQLIVQELTRLNAILPKLDATFAKEFYTRLRDLAQQVASSSGGVLGLNSIGDEEAQFVTLPMIKAPL